MLRKIGFALLWVGLLIYAFGFAPPDRPDTFRLIQNLSTGEWEGINPLIISLFNVMGIWPMVYSCVLFFDGRNQKIPAWPFVLFSFGVGAFALLPYLALREPAPGFSGEKNRLLKLLDSRWTGAFLAVGTLVLLGYGLTQGEWADFLQQWQTSRFIHVMSLDFCLLCLLFPALLGDDMQRRGLDNSTIFWFVSLLPLLGPVLYLTFRPPLAEKDQPIQMEPSVSR
ncbi:DUF2834 domain-containing protein [Phormidium sp. CCY1219]|uniref:DUF2834 domain-containing protein n=1 Tax=Phormidium sp. CCY1219 TaxID=2886104 RepID=UPI002D1F44AA|nr:DUF2834 domain-containing protein [Phormidium sp. CCY1219]MEB3827914.1 DUF2834 domain-containing protein [Phormidium sp. CCY1219]